MEKKCATHLEVKLVNAKLQDLPEVFSMVRDLAEYEKAPNEVTTDLQEYTKCFEQGDFEVIMAKKDEVTLGIALYYTTFSTWKGRMIYLEDFIVKEEYRQQGIGSLLFDRFIEISKGKDAKLIKWQVLNWNTPAIKFYEKKGATIEKEWWNGKIIF